jgi:ElaB/YqjD/DUF883 family membrane-anchored ribosome-binding protein
MAKEPDVIRQEMAETRASLTDKIEALENQVKDTVQEATAAVASTVENVKEAVQHTVDTVKGTVTGTVEGVKEAFDLNLQVDRHPWLMMTASAGIGFGVGLLLGGPRRHHPRMGREIRHLPPERSTWPSESVSSGPVAGHHRAEANLVPERAAPRQNWTDLLWPELNKLKGMAIGYTVAAIRDVISESLPHEMQPQIADIASSLTSKLGGQPIHDRVLQSSWSGTSSTESARTSPREQTPAEPFTEASARW